MLLTQSRKEICSSCLQEYDVKAKEYDWDLATSLDLWNVYKPPILNQSLPSAPMHPGGRHILKLYSGDTQKEGSVSGEYYESESDDESEPGNLMKKKHSRKGPVTMKCSLKQFVALLENLFVFMQYTSVVHHCSVTTHHPVMLMTCFLPYPSLWLRSLLIALARRDTNGSSRSYTSCQKL
jgi:hypothetical protein